MSSPQTLKKKIRPNKVSVCGSGLATKLHFYLFCRPQLDQKGLPNLFLKYSGCAAKGVSRLIRDVYLEAGYPGEWLTMNFIRKLYSTRSRTLSESDRAMVQRYLKATDKMFGWFIVLFCVQI